MNIVKETNRYAAMVIDGMENTTEGAKWEALTVARLKAFLAIHIYMGLLKQSNLETYWHKEGSIFHCPMVSTIMSRCAQFKELQRCMSLIMKHIYTLCEEIQHMTKFVKSGGL